MSPRVQLQPASTAQDASQPSPGVVSPSSQYPVVGFTTKPSPHISDHELAVVVLPPDHCHLGSTAHDEEQPSVDVLSPSSQYVAAGLAGIIFPSPQKSSQILALEELPDVHVHPDSTAQDASQPSPGVVSPSSQYPVATSTT